MGTLIIGMVFGLVLAGYDTGSDEPYDGPKTIKITGITGIGTERDGKADVRVKASANGSNPSTLVARINVTAVAGVLTAHLKMNDGDWDPIEKSWTGSGEYYIRLELAGIMGWPTDYPNGELPDGFVHSKTYFWAKDGEVAKYDITDALTTLDFSQFKQN